MSRFKEFFGGCFNHFRSGNAVMLSHIQRGFVLYRKHQYQQAITKFHAALEYGDAIDATIGIYLSYKGAKDAQNAADFLSSCEVDDRIKGNKLIKFFRGLFYQENHENEKALNVYKDILGDDFLIGRDRENIRLNLSDLREEDDLDKEDNQSAEIKDSPHDMLAKAFAMSAVGDLVSDESQLLNYNWAIQVYENMIGDLDVPRYYIPQIYYYKSQILQKIGKHKMSLESSNQAINEDRNYIDAMIHSAKICSKSSLSEHDVEADDILDRAILVNRHDLDALRVKAELAYKNGNYDESLFLCRQIDNRLTIFSGSKQDILAWSFYQKGWNFIKLSRSQSALTCFKQAISNDNSNVLYHLSKGLAYMGLEKAIDSIKSFEMAYKLTNLHDPIKNVVYSLVMLTRCDIKSLCYNSNHRDVDSKKISLIQDIVEKLCKQNISTITYSILVRDLNLMIIEIDSVQKKINEEIIKQDCETEKLLTVSQKLYAMVFKGTICNIYIEYNRWHINKDAIYDINGFLEQDTSPVLLFLEKLSGIKFNGSIEYEFALNFLTLAPSIETFDVFANHLAISIAKEHNICKNDKSESRIRYEMRHSFERLIEFGDSRQYDADQANMAYYDACHFAVEVSKGHISAFPSYNIIERSCDFVLQHEFYLVPGEDVIFAGRELSGATDARSFYHETEV